ncbi:MULTISPECIES: helix-turn-helix transcriptional regulator [unclassified Enterobacter]|uniref:helix-turn-helix transcriptional regulator n=1 Tax=unclassified Enterobacter TaxID=2608935 RepID=UPI001618FADB|nr:MULTISPECIES: helix-turn-helix transcriptional regulator [unclassified Enterobacter]
MSNEAIAEEIGDRIENLRLKHNVGQAQLAEAAGISRETYRSLAKGRGTLVNVIAVLRALGEMERLSSMVEDIPVSPLLLAELGKNQRVRASGGRKTVAEETAKPYVKKTADTRQLITRKKDSGRGSW